MSLLLVLVLFVSSMPPVQGASKSSSCENGECVPKLIHRLEDLGKLYRKECLPKNIKTSEIESYHRKNGLSEKCWKYLTEINHLESEVLKHQNKLEARLGCEGKDCSLNASGNSLNSQLMFISQVEKKLSCTETKKRQVRNSCGSDMTCVLFASALGVGGYVAQKLLPASAKPKNCHLGNDSCLTRVAAGFLKATISFFEGSWDLLKMAGRAIKKKVGQFWNWVKGGEDHSSTSQLALAKASKNPGFFSMLVKDFPGTMKKVWSAFVGALKEWMKTSVLCQKWSGVPQFSKCLEPATSMDCLSCKSMVGGLCTVTGTLVAEIVPSFLTGGLITAAKYGASGATKIARLFKVSNKGLQAVKKSRLGKTTLDGASKIDDAVKVSRGLHLAKSAVQASLNAISKYLLSPTRKILKSSFTAVSGLMKKGGVFLAETPSGKFISFTGTVSKKGLKVILYPIDNPLTSMAYKSGVRSFDRVLSLGAPRLGNKTFVASSLIGKEAQMEVLLAKIERAKMGPGYSAKEIRILEEELLSKVTASRKEVVKAALLNDSSELKDILSHLYPELQYGDLAKVLPKEKVLQAEKELFLEIKRMPEGELKSRWLRQYEAHVAQGEQRSRVLGNSKNPFDEIKVGVEKKEAQAKFNVPLTPEELAVKKSITDFTDETQKELLREGTKTENLIKTSKSPVVYDVVAIGAGPNNGVAVSVLKETNPKLNVLVIEATEDMGTFNKLKGFDINTPEFVGNSGNNFPGSPVQLRDFNVTDASFASADDLGQLTVQTYKSADADMIFNNRVISWEKEPSPGAWPAKYKVETSNGITVYTNSGLAGTGFGPPITRLKDPPSIELVARHEKELQKVDLMRDGKYSPKITSVDDFLTIASHDTKAGRDAMSRYRGKKVLVIGAGDGGNIAVEATAGMNKYLNPKDLDTGIETIWLGQEHKTGQEFLESMTTRKNLRYGRIAEGLDNGKIKTENGYLARVEEFTNDVGEKQFKAFYTTKTGEAVSEPIIADNLVFATGYPNNHGTLTPIFKNMAKNGNKSGEEVVFESLNGRVDNFTPYREFKTDSEITKQLAVNGQMEDVYATGVFAKTPISDDEWKVPTGGFLDITAAKAAATGEMVGNKLSPQKITKAKVQELLKVKTGERFEFIRVPFGTKAKFIDLPNEKVADIYTRTELGKTLRVFKSAPNSKFRVAITRGVKNQYVYQISGLEKKAAAEVVKALSQNSRLTYALESQFKFGKTQFHLEVPARATGSIKIESLIFVPLTVAIKEPINVPMATIKGLSKFTSPSIKTYNSRKEEQE